MKRAHIAAIAASTAALALAAALAGPLNPPSGPVAPTYRTLQEVEPRIPIGPATTPGSGGNLFVISQPGSYYLTGNIDVPQNMTGIAIACNQVTIDMRGFTISGHSLSGTGITSIDATVYGKFTLIGGNLTNFAAGIDLHVFDDASIHDVNVFACTGVGIYPPRSASLDSCAVTACSPCFRVNNDDTLTGCAADTSPSDGFSMTDGIARLVRCRSSNNAANGFFVGQAAGGATLDDCEAYGNGATGFNLGAGSVARRCRAQTNGSVGIYAVSDSTIADCECSGGQAQGIEVLNNCRVERCHCHDNGAQQAGIWVNGSANRVLDNDCSFNGFGLYLSTAGTSNFVARNTCHGNPTNYNSGWTAASNSVAPIVTSPGSNSFSSMTPWSNVAY